MSDEYSWKNRQDTVKVNEHLSGPRMPFGLPETNLPGENEVSREIKIQFTSRL
jgi:hypothetical protein